MNAGIYNAGVQACIVVARASGEILRAQGKWRDADACDALAQGFEALRVPETEPAEERIVPAPSRSLKG